MVRLKGFFAQESASSFICFNSNMVRLKGLLKLRSYSCIPGFNSNMVRLKGELEKGPDILAGFQFQYGSIKSRQSAELLCLHTVFQFQYGSIKSPLKKLRKS